MEDDKTTTSNREQTGFDGAIGDFRGWVRHLGRTGRLTITHPGKRLEFEVAAIAKHLEGRKAVLLPHPDGHPGTVVSGVVSNRGWIAEALGVDEPGLLDHFQNAVLNPIAWRDVADPACQKEVHEAPDLLALLPIPTHNAHDNGAYITAGLVIVRSPRTGRQNVSIHRLQISGPNRMGALLLPRHTWDFQQQAEAMGEDLDVAVVIGASPAALLASQAIVPLDYDELELAGALIGRPLPVAKCRNSEIRVPADAEIVIEGRLLANVRELEGPFGEFPQYYGERAKSHVIEVDLVTTRTNPIFHTIVGGGLEHLLLGGIPREATILANLKRNFPMVRDVHLSLGGVCRYHLYVKFKKRNEGEVKNVILGAMASHYDIKHVVVVDEDVNIHDPAEVEWAIATRFQADRDMVMIADSQNSKLDPSTRNGLGAKLGMDATIPLDAPEMRFRRIHVPGEDEVDIDACTDADADVDALLT